MNNTVRLQIMHDYQSHSCPYDPPEIERALTDLKLYAGLTERGWDKSAAPGIIRHETGPEIFALLVGLVELSAAILHLVAVTRKHRPETTVNVTVSDPADLKKVLNALGSDHPKT